MINIYTVLTISFCRGTLAFSKHFSTQGNSGSQDSWEDTFLECTNLSEALQHLKLLKLFLPTFLLSWLGDCLILFWPFSQALKFSFEVVILASITIMFCKLSLSFVIFPLGVLSSFTLLVLVFSLFSVTPYFFLFILSKLYKKYSSLLHINNESL